LSRWDRSGYRIERLLNNLDPFSTGSLALICQEPAAQVETEDGEAGNDVPERKSLAELKASLAAANEKAWGWTRGLRDDD